MHDEPTDEPETVAEVLALIAENPRDKELYQRLGGLYFQQRDLSKAWDAYMAALKLDPDDAFTCLYFANLLRLSDKDRAMKLYRRARKLAPELGVVHWCIAEFYRSLGQYYRAGKAYNQAVKAEPDCEMARAKLAEWHSFNARRRQADEEAFEAAVPPPEPHENYRTESPMPGTIDRNEFVALLTERYPLIAAEIDECSRGLLHLEMATLTRVVQAAISAEDVSTVAEHFRFIDEIYRRADPDVKNAVHVSYLESLSFDGKHGQRIKAREMLSPQLQIALRELDAYNAELFRRK